MCDYWHSTHLDHLATATTGLKSVTEPACSSDSVVYMINAIDSLADHLPRFVRHGLNHYSAMVLAQRYVLSQNNLVFDGGAACELACLSLWVSLESDGKCIQAHIWDAAVKQVFPCEVIHRGTLSGIEPMIGSFVSSLKFDLHIHHPFETVSIILGDFPTDQVEALSDISVGILNSLYRTSAVLEYPPYVLAVASIAGAILLNNTGDCATFLASFPVDNQAIDTILRSHLLTHLKHREMPLPDPPALEIVTSPSARTGRSVSRQSSRAVPSTGNTSNASLKRKRLTPLKPVHENSNDPLASLAWALLPRDENRAPNSGSAGMTRPISLGELKILRELAKLPNISGVVKLDSVSLLSEQAHHGKDTSSFLVNGSFDSAGTQFDSVLRLMRTKSDLISVFEQIVTAVHFLNENKLSHSSIEPRSFMVVGNQVKLACFVSATFWPNTPTNFPNYEYRAPELLLGTTSKDNFLDADLWSLGCLLAEISRIFFARNRYEDPLFDVTSEDRPPAKADPKGPQMDRESYNACRYLIKMKNVLNGGVLPTPEIWPGITKRTNFDKLCKLVEFDAKKFPGNPEGTLQGYIREDSSGYPIVLEIVKSLLRWCPERRAPPIAILRRIAKFNQTV
jgi:hypothetical protein